MAETRCFEAAVDGSTQSVDPATRRSRLATPGGSVPVWRHGGVLRLTWEVQAPEYLPDGPPHRPAVFLLAGGALGESRTHVLERVVVAPDSPDVHLHVDAVSPSADGSALGAVIHGYSGEWTDTYRLRIWSTEDLARRTLNAIGGVQQ